MKEPAEMYHFTNRKECCFVEIKTFSLKQKAEEHPESKPSYILGTIYV